jgi:hypothetical protein
MMKIREMTVKNSRAGMEKLIKVRVKNAVKQNSRVTRVHRQILIGLIEKKVVDNTVEVKKDAKRFFKS